MAIHEAKLFVVPSLSVKGQCIRRHAV